MSSPEPSPGGGTAAAAAGGMAASLVIMVCGLTAKSKKHAPDKPELDSIAGRMTALREDLVLLAAEDARAYDRVVGASKAVRSMGTEEAADGYQRALRNAAEVPLRTAEACETVLEAAARVSEIGLTSARSDVGVAVLLTRAGLSGAYMNVVINLESISDPDFARLKRQQLDGMMARSDLLSTKTLKKIGLG